MSTSPFSKLSVLRGWRSLLVLSLLTVLAFALRAGTVTAKGLDRARANFAEASASKTITLRWEDAAVLGVHWSSLAAAGIFLTAILTMRWWRAENKPLPSNRPSPPPASTAKWFLPALLGCVLLAAAVRAPLASRSLWWDEVWQLKNATMGEWRAETPGGELTKFVPSGWSKAAWNFSKPANHPAVSLPSRATLLAWQKVTGARPWEFSEIAVRLPVLLAGLTALVLAAFLAKDLAGDTAGALTALLFAIHPWLARYGVDCRSYGMAVLFITLALLALVRATGVKTRSPEKWWWLFGGAQFGLMWANPVSHLAVCAALTGGAAWVIVRSRARDRGRLLAQLFVINAAAAALLLLAFLPNLLQILTWHERNDDANELTWPYFWRTLCEVSGGAESVPAGNEPVWIAVLLLAGGAAAALSGAWWLRGARPRAAVPLLMPALGCAVFMIVVAATDYFFYHRFVISVSVPFVILAAVGLSRRHPFAAAGAVSAFAALTFPSLKVLLTQPYSPLRDVAAELRNQPAGTITAAYGLGANMVQAYHPGVIDIRENGGERLSGLVEKARRENRPLLVAWGYDGVTRANMPEGFGLLDDPAVFEHVKEWGAIEPLMGFQLARLRAE